jgi:hypothetical protein
MAVAAKATKAMGTVLAYTDGASETVGNLNTIGGIKMSATELDATHLDSASGYAEVIQGLRKGGDLAVQGDLDVDDAGQMAIITHFNQDADGGLRAMQITFLNTDASTWAFDAICKAVEIGDAAVDGKIPFAATFGISGMPTFTV